MTSSRTCAKRSADTSDAAKSTEAKNSTMNLHSELARLERAWRIERQAARDRFVEERKKSSLSDRVDAGIALDGLALDEEAPAPGERTLLWFRVGRHTRLRDLRLGPGDPVLLWRTSPDEEGAVRAVIARKSQDRIAVMIEGETPEQLEDAGLKLDREAPEVTFDRGFSALNAVSSLPPRSEERGRFERLFNLAAPLASSRLDALSFLDDRLEEDQKRAVERALARDLSLVLGPPGTGKTRTLAELVRQAVARGERVLVTAASHTAVDNLAERLVREGVRLVRIGHPARVSAEMESNTLDALLEATDSAKLAEGWVREAEQLRQRLSQRMKRGAVTREERYEVKREINGLFASARRATKEAQKNILQSATVIAATAAGADAWQLDGVHFDRVVLDEATQAPDPIALVALLRATKVVMAGDPFQLPPTVIATEAMDEGLSSTLFERLAAGEFAGELVTLLRVQHRMHEKLMAFPNKQTYSGQLRAAPEVATATLEQVDGVRADPLRVGPFVMLDSAGRGWDEEREDEDPSTRNPSNAARIAAEVERLLSRGVAASDIGVITPYNAQVRWIRDALESRLDEGLEVSTVDGFQGREKLVIVVDLVRSNDLNEIGFLADVRRMNVAITRAKRWLLVLGDGALMARHPYYKALLEHAEKSDAWLSAWSDEAEPLAL